MIKKWRGNICWLVRDENGKPDKMVDIKAYFRMEKIKKLYERSK